MKQLKFNIFNKLKFKKMNLEKKRIYRIRALHDMHWKPETIVNVPEEDRAEKLDKVLEKYLRKDMESLTVQCVLGKFSKDVIQQMEYWETSNMYYQILTPDFTNYDDPITMKPPY